MEFVLWRLGGVGGRGLFRGQGNQPRHVACYEASAFGGVIESIAPWELRWTSLNCRSAQPDQKVRSDAFT